MRYLFAARNRRALLEMLGTSPLVAFDYDGTLSPITAHRGEALLPPRTRELLTEVAEEYVAAIITGRSVADMSPRVEGVKLARIIGNHGMEPSPEQGEMERLVKKWVKPMEQAVSRIPGADLENKRFSLSVHYRGAPSPNLALRKILLAVQNLGEEARAVRGHAVVNIVPVRGTTKGGALMRAMRELGKETAIFAGDDWTDEDVFRIANPEHVLTIRVGRSSRSRASYYLRSQEEINDLMEIMVSAARAESMSAEGAHRD